MLQTLLMFHLEISGNESNEEHSPNKLEISFILIVFHEDISGNDFNIPLRNIR